MANGIEGLGFTVRETPKRRDDRLRPGFGSWRPRWPSDDDLIERVREHICLQVGEHGRSLLLDVVEGRSGAVVADWPAKRDAEWFDGVSAVALDSYRGYHNALTAGVLVI